MILYRGETQEWKWVAWVDHTSQGERTSAQPRDLAGGLCQPPQQYSALWLCRDGELHQVGQPWGGQKSVRFQNWQEARGLNVMFLFSPSLLFLSTIKHLSCTLTHTHMLQSLQKGIRCPPDCQSSPELKHCESTEAYTTACLPSVSHARLWSLHTWNPANSFYFKLPRMNLTESYGQKGNQGITRTAVFPVCLFAYFINPVGEKPWWLLLALTSPERLKMVQVCA